ncbi:branched-chain amino acid ABC transporter permease [bacterium]|nr:branched-chain amino acid ABC transporter permease [bacterium]
MNIKNIFIFILMLAAIVIFPLFVPNKYYISVMVVVGFNVLICIGLCMLMGYAGQISLGHAAFYGLGAYTSGVLCTKYLFNPWLAMLCGIIITGGVAYLIGVPSLKLKGHYLAMATLGFGEIVFIAFNELSFLTGGPSGMTSIPRLSLFGLALNTDLRFYCFTWVVVLVTVILSINIVNSRVGRALLAIHGSERAALAAGVNVPAHKIQIFVLSAIYASIAGSMYAHFVTFISPSSFGFMKSITLVTMVVIGGMSDIWGACIGALILTVLPEYLHVFHDYEILIFGVTLMIIMILMPKGLFVGAMDGIEWIKSKIFRKTNEKDTVGI